METILIVLFSIVILGGIIFGVIALVKNIKKRNTSQIKIGDTIVPESSTSTTFATVTFKNDLSIVDNDGNPTGSTAPKGEYEWSGISFYDRKVLIMFNNSGTLAAVLYTKKDIAFKFNWRVPTSSQKNPGLAGYKLSQWLHSQRLFCFYTLIFSLFYYFFIS